MDSTSGAPVRQCGEMPAAQPRAGSDVAAFDALVLAARLHHIAADTPALLHRLGRSPREALSPDDLLLAARELGLKARRSRAERLSLAPLPALALMRDGSVAVLAQSDSQQVLLRRFGAVVAASLHGRRKAAAGSVLGELQHAKGPRAQTRDHRHDDAECNR